jgi:phosphatidate phosphatase PAH1
MSAVVSDIDGTLTPNVLAINDVRPDAAQAISALSNKGYKIIYVTARVPLFQSGLPKWLQENGFPEGALHVAQSIEERSHPEIFKARILKDYVQHGWRLEYAYGDSSTDFTAYAEAGIPKERVFALRRRGSENCQKGVYQECLNGWTEYLPYIEKEIVTKE